MYSECGRCGNDLDCPQCSDVYTKMEMYKRALGDIGNIKGLVTGDWGDMLYAARSIAKDALAGRYTGWNVEE